MKKYLKYSGIVALVFALVAFILLMATTGVFYKYGNTRYDYEGTVVLFGATRQTWLGETHIKPAATGLVGWILIILAMLVLIAGIVLPLLKVKALEPFAGIMNLAAVIALIVGGVLVFFSVLAFTGANDWDADNANLGAGWVIAGILAILGGLVAILPAAVAFIGKKK